MRTNFKNQNGNAIVIIFIAIALFGALAFAFNQTSRTSTGFISDSQADAYASQIISYGNQVKDAVKRLQLRGCSDTEISFENNIVTGYANGNAPDNETCNVFSVSGGGLSWKAADQNIFMSAFSGDPSYGEYFFPDLVQVQDIGTTCTTADCTELIISLPYMNREICEKINQKLNVIADLNLHEAVTNHNFETSKKFIGIFNFETAGDTSVIGNTPPGNFPAGQPSACFQRTSFGHEYYNVLIVR